MSEILKHIVRSITFPKVIAWVMTAISLFIFVIFVIVGQGDIGESREVALYFFVFITICVDVVVYAAPM